MAIEILPGLFGVSSVFDGGLLVARIEEKDGGFVGQLDYVPGPEGTVKGRGLDNVAEVLVEIDRERRIREDYRPNPKRAIRGPRIRTVEELVAVFRTEPSVFWGERACPTAFLIQWKLILLLRQMRSPDGGFFHVLRREDYFDGQGDN